ncbi:MAG: hypothetical protein AAFX01_03855 [Cyanobacteria bacterium J06638_28]
MTPRVSIEDSSSEGCSGTEPIFWQCLTQASTDSLNALASNSAILNIASTLKVLSKRKAYSARDIGYMQFYEPLDVFFDYQPFPIEVFEGRL